MKFTLLCSPLHNSSSMWFLGDFLDIKFSLNSPRIEQLHLSNYHWFVITTGYGSCGRKGMEMRARDRRTQRLRNTGTAFVEAGNLEKSVSLEVPKCWTRLLTHPRGTGDFKLFLGVLVSFPWSVSVSCPSTSAWQAHFNKARQKREEVGEAVFVLPRKPRRWGGKASRHSEDESPLGAVRGAGNGSGRVCRLPHPQLPEMPALMMDKERGPGEYGSLERTGPGWRWSGLQRSSWLGPSQRGEIVNDFCEGPELRKWSSEKKDHDLPPFTLIENEIPSSGSGGGREKKSLSPYHFIMN